MESQKSLRHKRPLLARVQRALDQEHSKSPFVKTPEAEFLTSLKEELEKVPGVPKNTKLYLFENSRSKGR